jgi:hypothetical protein
VPETTEVLTDETADLLANISPDGSQFTFNGANAQLNSLKAGDIIMSDPTEVAVNGFLRRIVDVATVDGNTVVETIPATLEEADRTRSGHRPQKADSSGRTKRHAPARCANDAHHRLQH